MFVYILTASSSLTSSGALASSTITPSESIMRYVGMAGYVEGRSNERLVVNLLFTAPGKLTLATILSVTSCLARDNATKLTGLSLASVTRNPIAADSDSNDIL